MITRRFPARILIMTVSDSMGESLLATMKDVITMLRKWGSVFFVSGGEVGSRQ